MQELQINLRLSILMMVRGPMIRFDGQGLD